MKLSPAVPLQLLGHSTAITAGNGATIASAANTITLANVLADTPDVAPPSGPQVVFTASVVGGSWTPGNSILTYTVQYSANGGTNWNTLKNPTDLSTNFTWSSVATTASFASPSLAIVPLSALTACQEANGANWAVGAAINAIRVVSANGTTPGSNTVLAVTAQTMFI